MNAFPSPWPVATLKTLACAVPLALACGQASAQDSVTLYGLLDGSMVVSRSGAAGVGSVQSIASGVGTASFWGLRGTEDLGSGYGAIFQLEAGIDMDTGASKAYNGDYSNATAAAPNGPTISGFNRRAHVGLVTPYGTVQLGREYTPVFYTAAATDGMRLQYFGNAQALLALTAGAEREARVSNGIFYTSPVLAGFKARAAFSLGSESAGTGTAPPRHGNEFLGFGAEYVNGGLTLSGSYQTLRLPLTAGTPLAYTTLQQRHDLLLGARYAGSSYSVAAGRFRIDAPQKGTDTWLGGSVTFGVSTVYAQVQQLRQDNPVGAERRANLLGVAYAYNLSKRSLLYVAYGRTANNATGQFSVTGNDVAFAAGAAGATPSALAIGMRHLF